MWAYRPLPSAPAYCPSLRGKRLGVGCHPTSPAASASRLSRLYTRHDPLRSARLSRFAPLCVSKPRSFLRRLCRLSERFGSWRTRLTGLASALYRATFGALAGLTLLLSENICVQTCFIHRNLSSLYRREAISPTISSMMFCKSVSFGRSSRMPLTNVSRLLAYTAASFCTLNPSG